MSALLQRKKDQVEFQLPGQDRYPLVVYTGKVNRRPASSWSAYQSHAPHNPNPKTKTSNTDEGVARTWTTSQAVGDRISPQRSWEEYCQTGSDPRHTRTELSELDY